ncbi:MAG: leucine--tRNA ligase [Candidatus Aenigmatarchaeota archaeon]
MDIRKIEKKWQDKWAKGRIWEPRKGKKKFFMHFAYPGISGYQHVGHMRGFTYTDAICRYKRMTGHGVFFPIGTHASGNQAIGFANKVKKGDRKWIEYLIANGYPEGKMKDMEDPKKVVDYFNANYIENWKKYGFLADWDSFTCTIYPDYGKFIEWQFRKLNALGLLVKKPYFATFCSNCGPVAVDPSETDISKGGNAQKQEFTLIKFKLGDAYLVAATLRPETMFGQTNLWVDPNFEYAIAQVGTEKWICSPQCVEKLKNQKSGVKESGKIKGEELIGKYANALSIGKDIIILPCEFCDPNVGTGIVTSVPSDAPYDWMALKDLQKNCNGSYCADVKKLKPIPIIISKEYGDLPAVRICEEMGIKDQHDPKLEEATKIIYKKGFHTGVMNQNCGKYAGMPVEKAKEKIKEEMINGGKADVLYDLSEEVICRCGAKVIIKKIPDQWFIKYSDEKLKEKSKAHARTMRVYPQDYYESLPSVIDWFQDRACTRLGNWLGTKMPLDTKWTIEPIADSTLYPAYYIVSRFINSKKLKTSDLTEEFFDYVFLGEGKPKNAIWDVVKAEFEYWYPVDINLGGKEHQTVHFPVYVMNHVAIMGKKSWPKGIFVNYWLTGEGGKISKSKGGAAASPQQAAEMYGADSLRLYYAHISSPHADVVWNEDNVISYKNHVAGIYEMVSALKSLKGDSMTSLERWLLSKANTKLKQYLDYMEEYNLRKAVDIALFEFMNDMNRYRKRGGNNKKVAAAVAEMWLKMLAPFTPHICEECWEILGKNGMISTEQMPAPDEKMIDKRLEAMEEYVHKVLKDIEEIKKIAKIEKPRKITIFISPSWKYEAYNHALEGKDIKTVMQTPLKQHGSALAAYYQKLLKNRPTEELFLTASAETKSLKENEKFFREEYGCEIEIVPAEKSEHPKAKSAEPAKPGILLN